MRSALIVGGTGPTGPHAVHGLLERGYEVTLFHRGAHEPADTLPVEHIHGDPHFRETIEESLSGRTFDVVLSMYGRLRHIAACLTGRCEQFVGVGGIPVYLGVFQPERYRPYGVPLGAREDNLADETNGPLLPMVEQMRAAERAVFETAVHGGFKGSMVRYPQIYGPRNVIPSEWSVIQRVLDGRRHMILPDDGLRILSRCAARNAAAALLTVVDHPDEANGQAYSCADAQQLTLRQWAESIADVLGADIGFTGLPGILAEVTWTEIVGLRDLAPQIILDTTKIRSQLGYQDVVPAADALRETVEWLLENPPRPGEYPGYADTFDYEAEDRLIEEYQSAIHHVISKAGREQRELFHPLPHPKSPRLSVDERGR
jgi:nucleoside-diphosphate-sugar epimerase